MIKIISLHCQCCNNRLQEVSDLSTVKLRCQVVGSHIYYMIMVKKQIYETFYLNEIIIHNADNYSFSVEDFNSDQEPTWIKGYFSYSQSNLNAVRALL